MFFNVFSFCLKGYSETLSFKLFTCLIMQRRFHNYSIKIWWLFTLRRGWTCSHIRSVGNGIFISMQTYLNIKSFNIVYLSEKRFWGYLYNVYDSIYYHERELATSQG